MTPIIVIIGMIVCMAMIPLLPWKQRNPPEDGHPQGRYDERGTVFSRGELLPDTERYRQYYRRHPESEKPSCV